MALMPRRGEGMTPFTLHHEMNSIPVRTDFFSVVIQGHMQTYFPSSFLGCHPLFDHNNAFDIDYMKDMDAPYQFDNMTIRICFKTYLFVPSPAR